MGLEITGQSEKYILSPPDKDQWETVSSVLYTQEDREADKGSRHILSVWGFLDLMTETSHVYTASWIYPV